MDCQLSFPVFNLELDNEFESSDEKYQLKRKQNTANTHLIDDGNITAFSTIGKRNSNLDSFSYMKRETYSLLAVYDGHGDDKVVKYLEENLLFRVANHQIFEVNPKMAITSVLHKIEEQVLQIYEKGSTVLIALVKNDKILAANIGDSKLFALRKQDGELQSLTKQHNLKNQKEVAQIISKGGYVFRRGSEYRINGQLNISRSIGDKKHKGYMSSEPEFYEFEASKYKKLMLVTDGFYNHQLFESELCRKSLKEIENKVKKGCIGYGFDDNATIVCFKFKPNLNNIYLESSK